MSESENYVHLWLGSNFSPEAQYLAYFKLDHSVEGNFDDPDYKTCPFCEDIGISWYDEDFIGIIPRNHTEISLDEILVEAAVDDEERKRVKRICEAQRIHRANAIFWYQDAELIINSPKDQYNKLKYIGLFKGD